MAFVAIGALFIASEAAGPIIELCRESADINDTNRCSRKEFIPAALSYMNAYQGAITALATGIIGIFTAYLAKATAGLRESTEKLWIVSEQQLRMALRAAEAAENSASAAIKSVTLFQDSERGRVSVSLIAEANSVKAAPDGATIRQLIYSFRIHNFGRTAVFINGVSCGLGFLPEGEEPEPFLLPEPFIAGVLPGGGATPGMTVRLDVPRSTSQETEYLRGTDNLWFLVRIDYVPVIIGQAELVDLIFSVNKRSGKLVFRKQLSVGPSIVKSKETSE